MGKKGNKSKDETMIMKIKSNSSSVSLTINKHIKSSINNPMIINDYTSLDIIMYKNTYCVIDICISMDEEISNICIDPLNKDNDSINYNFVQTISENDEKNKRYYRLSFMTPDNDIIININIKDPEITKQEIDTEGHSIIFDENISGEYKIYIVDKYSRNNIDITSPYIIKPGEFVSIEFDSSIVNSQNIVVSLVNEETNYIYLWRDYITNRISFWMPPEDIKVSMFYSKPINNNEKMEEINKMEKNGVIDYFEIPDELAKELSDNLIKQTIRQRTLVELVNDPERYNSAEKLLIPIVSKVEAIKVQITNQYVPEKYRSSEYIWNYDGYEVDGNKVQIHKV